ncbi:uncharacterized protein LOC114890626 [Monodon monoceros]|uniref:uncharacterized protein LOC114890023 n=1 Tax=Monodon monoceros TaxID=40151 RepID=UPI0010F68CD8|nr:uncharacterized protein LOC114890023 [Monodon monoceros]XP_029069697.1 uncharacterized protein LOC114890434 [Monodon monoceros]XP_029070136.1 uncharacterized protein LOC114890626 [Monodon monoceros]
MSPASCFCVPAFRVSPGQRTQKAAGKHPRTGVGRVRACIEELPRQGSWESSLHQKPCCPHQTCAHPHRQAHMHTCMCTCRHSSHTGACVRLHMQCTRGSAPCKHKHTHVCKHMQKQGHMHVGTRVRVCSHAHTRIHTHTHRHTCAHAAHTRTRTGDSTEWWWREQLGAQSRPRHLHGSGSPRALHASTPPSDAATAPLTQGGLGSRQSDASQGLEKTLVLASTWSLPATARSPRGRPGSGPGPDQPQAFSPRQEGRPVWRTPARVPASGILPASPPADQGGGAGSAPRPCPPWPVCVSGVMLSPPSLAPGRHAAGFPLSLVVPCSPQPSLWPNSICPRLAFLSCPQMWTSFHMLALEVNNTSHPQHTRHRTSGWRAGHGPGDVLIPEACEWGLCRLRPGP